MRVLPLVLILSLTGCSAIVSGSRQSVMVTTPEADGATCSLTDSKGRVWYIESTPGTAYVKRGDGPIAVICKKEGYDIGTGEIKEGLANASYGNLALLPLAPVGYFVDSVTGSSERYDATTEIEMNPSSGSKMKDHKDAKSGKEGAKPWE